MKVPDSFIPMEPEDFIILQAQRSKRDNYWLMLQNARNEYFDLVGQSAEYEEWSVGGFYYYLRQYYGIQVETIDGKITGEYAITDEQKYLMFIMKFGS
jgi:hypothetical protein